MSLEPRYPYGIEDAARYLGLSKSTVYELVEQKKIACVRQGRVRFSQADLDAFLDARRQRVEAVSPSRRTELLDVPAMPRRFS